MDRAEILKNKGVKLEYKQTERQVDFFSDYTQMFGGQTHSPLCLSILLSFLSSVSCCLVLGHVGFLFPSLPILV